MGFYTGSNTNAVTRQGAGATATGGYFLQILQSVASATTLTNTDAGTTSINSVGALVKVLVRAL